MLWLRKTTKTYYLWIILGTLGLYIWQLYLNTMINTDGVTYLEGAAAYMEGGLKAVLAIDDQAKWPFYSIVIAWVHQLTHFSLITSQRVLDALFISASACLFLRLVQLFSHHPRASFWGVLIWLTWHGYVKWWPVVVRDNGFLVCLLLSFYFLYRFMLSFQWRFIILWTSSLLIAELFRIEAALYLLFLPFSVFFLFSFSKKKRFYLWLKLNVLSLACLIGLIFLFATGKLTIHSFRFAYMWQELSLYFKTTITEFLLRYDVIKASVFYRENPYPGYTLAAGYLMLFVCYVIAQVGFVILPILCYLRPLLKRLNRGILFPVFGAYFFLALLIPLLFFIEYAFLNGRYLIPLGLFVQLLVASALPHLLDVCRLSYKPFLIGILSLLLTIHAAANFYPFGHRTVDDMVVGAWLKTYYPDQSLFTDTKRILFYASEPPSYRHGLVHEMWLHGTLGTGVVWLRENSLWCDNGLLVLSTPKGKDVEEKAMFAQLQQSGAIGPIIKSFKRKSNGEMIYIAPILHQGCVNFVHKFAKKS